MVSGHEIAMALRGAYRTMHGNAEDLLRPHGVTAQQFVLLSLLAEGQGVTQRELVRGANSDPNTVRAMLVLLERRGLVTRRPHRTDGRARCVALTEKGRSAHAVLWAKSQAFHARLLKAIGPDEAPAFIQQLRALEHLTEPKPCRPHSGAMGRPPRRSRSRRPSPRSTAP